MRIKDHKRISKKIFKNLDPEKHEVVTHRGVFEEGSVKPDEWKDYPHHRPSKRKHGTRKDHVETARRNLVNGDKKEALFQLGVALHYVADLYCPQSKNSRHNRFESKISSAKIENGLLPAPAGKEETLKLAEKNPTVSENTWTSTKLVKSPKQALNEAYRTCAQIASDILAKTEPPSRFVEEYVKSSKKVMEKKNWFKGLGVASLLIPLPLLADGFLGIVGFVFLFLLGLFSNFAPVFPFFVNSDTNPIVSLSELPKNCGIAGVLTAPVLIGLLAEASVYFVVPLLLLLVQIGMGSMAYSYIDKKIRYNKNWYNWNSIPKAETTS